MTTKVISCNWTAQWRGLPVAAESCAASAASSLMWTEIGVDGSCETRAWDGRSTEMKWSNTLFTLCTYKRLWLMWVQVQAWSIQKKRSQSTCEPNGHSMEYMDPQPLLKWWFWTGFKPVTMAPTPSVDDAWCIDPVLGLVSQSAMIQAASSMQNYCSIAYLIVLLC